MQIKRIHHLTIAVRDLDGARLTFEQLFDVRGGDKVDLPAFGVRAVDVPIGDDVLQLASPIDADNPVMRFLERKGEGFYNLALEVEGLDETVRELASQGVRVSDPAELEPGVRSAFVTMAATHGLSVQLVEVAGAADKPVSSSAGQPVDESAGQAETETVAHRVIEDEPLPEEAPPSPRQPLPEEAPPSPRRQLLDLTPDEWSDVD